MSKFLIRINYPWKEFAITVELIEGSVAFSYDEHDLSSQVFAAKHTVLRGNIGLAITSSSLVAKGKLGNSQNPTEKNLISAGLLYNQEC